MQWAARVVTKCRQAVFGAFENRRDRPGDLNLQAATGGKIFKNAVWRKKRACVTTSHFLLSLSVPGVLSLSPFHSLFPSATFSLFHPPPLYMYIRTYVCISTYMCTRVLVVWRFPSSTSLFTRSSPPKQIVKTPSTAVIAQSFPKNQWPLAKHMISFLSDGLR